jgi:hypothetical protein
MNLKQTLVGAGLVGLLATGSIAMPSVYASINSNSGSKQKQEYNIKQEYNFNSERGYSIPFNVSKKETILSGTDGEAIVKVFNLAVESSKRNQWTHALIPIDEAKYPDSGADMYMRVYLNKNIFTQITIGWRPYETKQSLDEYVDEFIEKSVPATGNSYIGGSRSKIKLDQKDAIEFKLKGKIGKTMIFTMNKDKVYGIVYGSYYIQKEGDAIDPENSLKTFEKGFKFSD